MALILFFLTKSFHKWVPLSQVKDHHTIATTMFRGWILSTLAMLRQLVALALTPNVKITCLVTSLTFEFECFISCIKTHIPMINSWVVMASLLGIKELGKLD
jgi:hypothetical protein